MRRSSNATTIFVLGLLGLIICGFLAPVAWVMGNEEVNRCRRDRVRPDGLAVAGRVLGIIGTILLILGILVVVLAFCVAPSGPTVEPMY